MSDAAMLPSLEPVTPSGAWHAAARAVVRAALEADDAP